MTGIILRQAEAGKGCISIHQGVFVLDNATDVRVTGLNNLLQQRIFVELELIAGIHGFETRHQLLKEGLASGAILIDGSRWTE